MDAEPVAVSVRGLARSPGPSYQSVIAADAVTAPATNRTVLYEWCGDTTVTADRYTARAFSELEAERLWPSVWQMACRVEHLPEVGSYVSYEVADVGLIVVRTAPDRIRAYHNACLHRGTTLVEGDGRTGVFRCPFHGFTWSLDGSLAHVPAGWDFPHVRPEDLRLPEASVALWGGFVFVNPDGTAEDFDRYAAPLAEHFAGCSLEDRYVAAHAGMIIDANWKAAMEAFLESYHLATTHPQTIRFINDTDAQYDLLGRNVTRFLEAVGVPVHALIGKVSNVEIAERGQRVVPAEFRRQVPPDVEPRAFLAERMRDALSAQWQVDLSAATPAELLDSNEFHLFPNFVPWRGWYLPAAYRFRPWGDSPDRCLMDVMMLHPRPRDGSPVETASMTLLEPGRSWTEAPGFEAFGMVYDQDCAVLPRVQRGLRRQQRRALVLADYQEMRLSYFHRRLNEQLGIV